jgi:hypothetical protein
MSGERRNFYKEIHKGIRALAHSVEDQAGRTDFRDAGEVAVLRETVERAFAVFESHAANETAFVTPALRACAPSAAADSDAEHRAQELRLRDLRAALALAAGAGERAPAFGHAFVVGLSRFVGEMLVHMAEEEERLMPALQAAYDDAALLGIHQAILASLPPQEKAEAVALMLPALNAPERAELLAGIRASAPAAAFEAIAGLARRVLSPADWGRLERSLATAA